MIQDDLVCIVILCADNSQDDGPRILHVLPDEVENQVFVGLCLGVVGGMNEARKIDKSATYVSGSLLC